MDAWTCRQWAGCSGTNIYTLGPLSPVSLLYTPRTAQQCRTDTCLLPLAYLWPQQGLQLHTTPAARQVQPHHARRLLPRGFEARRNILI